MSKTIRNREIVEKAQNISKNQKNVEKSSKNRENVEKPTKTC